MSDYEEYKEWIKDYEKSSGEKVDKNSIEREGHGWESHEVLKFCNKGGECFLMVENEDEAVAIAEEQVREDLEREPQLFNQDWLQSHIDEDSAENYLREVFDEWNWGYVNDIESEGSRTHGNRLIEELLERGIIDEDDLDKDGDVKGTVDIDNAKEKMVEEMTQSQIDEGLGGLEHIRSNFGKDEVARIIKEANLIDIDEATEDAVSTDGWAHFISRYDGSYEETKEGRVYWRGD